MAERGWWEATFTSTKKWKADLGTLPLKKAIGLPSREELKESLAKEEHAAAEDAFGVDGFYIRSTRSRLSLEMENQGYVYRCSYLPDAKKVQVSSTWSKPPAWAIALALALFIGSALFGWRLLVSVVVLLLIERIRSYFQFREAAARGQREIMLHLNAKGLLIKEES